MYLPRVFIEKYRTQRIPTSDICHLHRTDGYSTLAAPKMNMSCTWDLKIQKNAVNAMTHITYLVLRDTKQKAVTNMTHNMYLVLSDTKQNVVTDMTHDIYLVLRGTNKTQSPIRRM